MQEKTEKNKHKNTKNRTTEAMRFVLKKSE